MNTSRLVQTFCDLVSIDSPSGRESNVAQFISQELNQLGIICELDAAGNLFARVPGQGDPTLLCAHMDTVEPGKNIRPIIEDGYIKSSGDTILGADNKASVAAILEALKSTQQTNRKSLELLFTTREETDGGINQFEIKKIKSKNGLIADRAAPVGTIVLSSPWVTDITFKFTGQAAHAASPEKGDNALTKSLSMLSSIPVGRVDPDTTINIGTIAGGTGTNTVPDLVIAQGEIRSFSKQSHDTWLAKINPTSSKLYCPGYAHTNTDSFIQETADLHKKLGIAVDLVTALGASDANHLNSQGIKVVNIGYGAEITHTTSERISVSSLIDLASLLVKYIVC